MRVAIIRQSTLGLVVVLIMALAGCVGVGGYGVGFYEPAGYDYGGWQRGYLGPPPRGGYEHQARPDEHQARPDEHQARPDEHQARSDAHGSQPSYRPAPPSRSIPSIPTQSRGGQSRGSGRSGH